VQEPPNISSWTTCESANQRTLET